MNRSDIMQMTVAGLNLIQQALTIYDANLRLAVCNRRFQEMFDLPDVLVTTGAKFADTIRHLAERGDYGDVSELEQFVADRVEIARTFEPHYMERTRANGRIISVEGSPLPQGGWVTVYTDITKTRRQEDILNARSEELADQLTSYSRDLAAANRKLEATITALEEAKYQITEAEARIRLTTEMMPAHIAHIDRNWLYTYSNRRLSTIMPGTRPDPVGLDPKTVLGDQPFSVLEPNLKRAFNGEPSVFEFNHEQSSRRIRVALTPDPASGGVYILSMDITEETQTRAALQQTRRREMAAQLTSGLAHDFSNLLTIILGMQSRLQGMDLPEDGAELIAATIGAARRGGGLLDRIADMTGPREHSPEPTHLSEFIRDLSTLVISMLPDGVHFETFNNTQLESLLLDPGMLQDSLLNLAINARDACGTKGKITLRIESVQDTWIDFTMEDTGPGFSETAKARAFDPFFTTKGEDGSGLGLTMVYDMTKLAGGRVIVGNHVNGGKVTLRLPLRASEETGQPGLVLLVEDSPDLRNTIRVMLRGAGHTVVEATSVSEALTLAKDMPEINAVLSDILLEGEETGLDLTHALSDDPRPVFLMTSLPLDDPRHCAARDIAPVLRKTIPRARIGRVSQTWRHVMKHGSDAPLVTILDDEPAIRSMLANALEDAGFQTMSFARASDFEVELSRTSPDVCLVDLSLPDKDGLTLVHQLALEQGARVIIISGRAEVRDRVTGLELGADDYIIKPFDPSEVVARIRAHLRRDTQSDVKGNTAAFNGWVAHFDRYILSDEHGIETPFSHAEGEVLRLFLERPKRLISRQTMQEVLGGTAGESFDRAMDVRVSRLRTKLREDPKNPKLIKTIYGAGYIFLGDAQWS